MNTMYRRTLIILSGTGTVFPLAYFKIAFHFVLAEVENKFPGELFKVSNESFFKGASLYAWELEKRAFYYFFLCLAVISLCITAVTWRKGNGYKTTGLLFVGFSGFTLLNALNRPGFWSVNLPLLLFFVVLFVMLRKTEKARFIVLLFILCSVLVNTYCYLIGFGLNVH